MVPARSKPQQFSIPIYFNSRSVRSRFTPKPARFEDFGPYAIERALGKGGMGEVFLAHDRTADRLVAIKFLYNLWSAPGIEERFTREIQNLAKLEHPFIARLYDAGIHPCGAPYFAMEFVAGEPLDNYCRERESSIGIRLQLFYLVCQAVEYAHTRLIVHCDLKPSNILVENDAMLKVVDFGVSRKLVALDEPASQAHVDHRIHRRVCGSGTTPRREYWSLYGRLFARRGPVPTHHRNPAREREFSI